VVWTRPHTLPKQPENVNGFLKIISCFVEIPHFYWDFRLFLCRTAHRKHRGKVEKTGEKQGRNRPPNPFFPPEHPRYTLKTTPNTCGQAGKVPTNDAQHAGKPRFYWGFPFSTTQTGTAISNTVHPTSRFLPNRPAIFYARKNKEEHLTRFSASGIVSVFH